MGRAKSASKTPKTPAKWTEAQTRSLLDSLQDETKGLNMADNNFQPTVWMKALKDLNESFGLQLDLDQVKNHFSQVSFSLVFRLSAFELINTSYNCNAMASS